LASQDRTIDPHRRVGPEVRKTMRMRIESGFFARFMSGEHILDIGYRGGDPENLPILPWAEGVEKDYPGYDGLKLPFDDQSQDAVHSSHCLEHIADPAATLAEWFRVLRIGGYLIITVPHQQLYERKPVPISRMGGNEHLRFYTVASLTKELEDALPVGEFRYRLLRDNDAGFDYGASPLQHPKGCYEIEVVIERIACPAYADQLRLSPRARSAIATYRTLLEGLLRDASSGIDPDPAVLEAFGRACPIPPFPLVRDMFPEVAESTWRHLIWPLVEPSVVDDAWYTGKHVDVRAAVSSGLCTAKEHYRRAGYFECKLPSNAIGVYG
jgi:SAM-dependent methyltransferase